MSRGWKTEGLQAREGDGLYGLSGARLTATRGMPQRMKWLPIHHAVAATSAEAGMVSSHA